MFQLTLARGAAQALAVALSVLSLAAQADTITRTSSFEYNAKGLLIKEVVEPDRPNDCLQTSNEYGDSFGNKTKVTTAACAGASGYTLSSAASARSVSVGYGTDGRFARTTTNALTQSETKDYDARFGSVTSLTGPNQLTTTWQFDGFGRKTRETRADGTYTTWTHLLCTDAGANCPGPIGGATSAWVVVEQSYAANATVSAPEKRQFHDTLDRVVRVQTQGFDGSGVAPALVQDTEYNTLGQVARKSDVYALSGGTPVWTTYKHDALGRLEREETPDPDAGASGVAVTLITYNGLTTTATNSKGQQKTTTKNAQGHVVQVTDNLNNTLRYAYDALGNLLATNAAGSITRMGYNQRGQKTSMLDPAMGAWAYAYNAFGELVWQRDSLGQTATMDYDVLGRMTRRTEPDLISDWSYDKKFDATACGKGVGKLCEAKSNNSYLRSHTYDAMGRVSSTATVLDSAVTPATVSVAYDANTGRVTGKTWPTGYQASYTYTSLGYLKTVTGGGANGFAQSVSYEVQATNAQGQITQYRYGNQVTTVKTYNDTNHRLGAQAATFSGQASGNVLNQSYRYDSLGNITERQDNSPGVGTKENFSYDGLNRLSLATIVGGGVSGAQTVEVLYDPRGNIRYKSDVGLYAYDGARPNRMIGVSLEADPAATVALSGTRALSYVFDDAKPQAINVDGVLSWGNGNLESTDSHDALNNRHTRRTESYTSFGMPGTITHGTIQTDGTSTPDRSLSFVYGPEHQRIRQIVSLSGNGTSAFFAGNTWYLNGEDSLGLSYEKEVRANGTVENKHYVSAGGVVFALHTSRTGTLNGLAAEGARYFHHDHLGSVVAISDTTGTVVERLAFDPWGKRRNVNGVADVLDSIVPVNTERGFTLHEHLDEVGVVHMNGRLYDPLIGRFMSADPFIQSPGELQSYNRYAYVMNNPLSLTDPSGYFSTRKLFGALFCPFCIKEWRRPILAMTAGYFIGPWVSALTQSTVIGGAVGGFASGAIGTGTTNGALHGALTGGLFGAAGHAGGFGEAGAATPERYLAHAAAGCISSVAGGGKCGQGAASAVFGKWATNNIDVKGDVAKGVAAVVSGGVGSVIAGGKFENGAVTAAYGYVFNFLASKEANINEGGAVKDTSFSVDFDSKLEIDLRDPPPLMDKVGVGKWIRRIWLVEDAREAAACGLKTSGGGGCFGTRDLPADVKEQARKLDVDAARAANDVMRQNPTWSLSNLSRTQFLTVLQAVDAAVPAFRAYYGSPSEILSRFPEPRE